jgi:hypothetical protein
MHVVGVLGSFPLSLAWFRPFVPSDVTAPDLFSLVLAVSPEISEFSVVGVSTAV